MIYFEIIWFDFITYKLMNFNFYINNVGLKKLHYINIVKICHYFLMFSLLDLSYSVILVQTSFL